MTELATTPSRRPPLRRSAARHPIAAFLIIAFSIGYPVMSLIALAVHRVIPGAGLLDLLPIPPDEVAGLLLTLGALLPAALYVTWATDGRPGVIKLLHRLTNWRFGLRWWLVIVAALPALTIAFGLMLGDSLLTIDPVDLLLAQLPLLLINFLLVNLWEETAWAGVVQTRLGHQHNLFLAAGLTAIPFGFAHWPLAWLEPSASLASAMLALPAHLLLGLLVRPYFGLTLSATGGSLLAVALTHSILNRTQNSNGIAATLLDGQGHRLGVLIALLVLTGLFTLLLRPGVAGPTAPARFRRRRLRPGKYGYPSVRTAAGPGKTRRTTDRRVRTPDRRTRSRPVARQARTSTRQNNTRAAAQQSR